MKKFLLIAILLLQMSYIFAQTSIDVYAEGMAECMGAENFETFSTLFEAVDERLAERMKNSENPYFDFSVEFCDGKIGDDFFAVEENSELDAAVKRTLATDFWFTDTIDISDTQPEFEVVPPGGIPPKIDPDSIENTRLKPGCEFISCSKIFALHRVIATYYGRYDLLGMAGSETKLCGLLELFDAPDFELNSVKYFIITDVILQRILHKNDYQNFIK